MHITKRRLLNKKDEEKKDSVLKVFTHHRIISKRYDALHKALYGAHAIIEKLRSEGYSYAK